MFADVCTHLCTQPLCAALPISVSIVFANPLECQLIRNEFKSIENDIDTEMCTMRETSIVDYNTIALPSLLSFRVSCLSIPVSPSVQYAQRESGHTPPPIPLASRIETEHLVDRAESQPSIRAYPPPLFSPWHSSPPGPEFEPERYHR